jgi:hypothetical protein
MRIGRLSLITIGALALAVAAKKAKKRIKLATDAYRGAVSSGSRPIEGVGTAVAAFVGLAESGPFP